MNYDFYRRIDINNFKVDVLVDLTREKIILQFDDDQLLKFLESLNGEVKNYTKITINDGDIM